MAAPTDMPMIAAIGIPLPPTTSPPPLLLGVVPPKFVAWAPELVSVGPLTPPLEPALAVLEPPIARAVVLTKCKFSNLDG